MTGKPEVGRILADRHSVISSIDGLPTNLTGFSTLRAYGIPAIMQAV
jgi:hypothetical protein